MNSPDSTVHSVIPLRLIRWWQQQRLIAKHSILLIVAGLFVVPIIYGSLSLLLLPTFEKLEKKEAADQISRVRNALERSQTALGASALDYAQWDDSYEYIQRPFRAFEIENFRQIEYFENLDIEYWAYVRADGKIVWSRAIDASRINEDAASKAALDQFLASRAFIDNAIGKKQHSIHVEINGELFILASANITKADLSGNVVGSIIMGKRLAAANLSGAVQLPVGVLNDESNRFLGLRDKIAGASHWTDFNETSIDSYVVLKDVSNRPIGLITFNTDRHVFFAGQKAILLASFGMLIALAFLTGLLGYGIRWITIKRLQALERHIKSNNNLTKLSDTGLAEGADEIASLAQGFQLLAINLARAENELRTQSYVQGKVDSAAGVLHNVRNALVPIGSMHGKWLEDAQSQKLDHLRLAIDELSSLSVDPQRRENLEKFLLAATKEYLATTNLRKVELEEMRSAINQVSGILGSYHDDSDTATKQSGLSLLELIDQSASSARRSENENIEIKLPESDIMVSGNHIQLIQVFTNLFVNAAESLDMMEMDDKQIVVNWSENCNTGYVTVTVSDNGEGMDPMTLERAFERGFSTRKHKSGGLGLHWCANTVSASGGRLKLESDGSGKGAQAIVSLKSFVPAAMMELQRVDQAA